MDQSVNCFNSPLNGEPSRKLLIASEVRFLRESLGEIIRREGDDLVLGYCANFDETVNMSCALRPNILLLDAAMEDGVMAVSRLREATADVRVVVFAVNETVESVLRWAEAGVAGYIPRTAAIDDLRSLVAEISAGRQICSATVAAGLLKRLSLKAPDRTTPAANAPALTPRELETVRLISNGLSNKEIARRLKISPATTKSHVHNILGKLNLARRGQVTFWIRERGHLL